MRRPLKILGWIVGVVLVLAVGATGIARVVAGRRYNRHWTTHEASFPIPFPLSAAELEVLRQQRLAAGAPSDDPLSGNMPIVANLTPHETGLKGWTEADFIRALREGKRKDGTDILPAMPWKAYGQMNDVEIKALWAYLLTVPPAAKGNH